MRQPEVETLSHPGRPLNGENETSVIQRTGLYRPDGPFSDHLQHRQKQQCPGRDPLKLPLSDTSTAPLVYNASRFSPPLHLRKCRDR